MASPSGLLLLKQSTVRLYRCILTLHRRMLPWEVRNLMDKQVRYLFREHWRKKEHVLREFIAEWDSYYTDLRRFDFGVRLGPDLPSPYKEIVQKRLDARDARLKAEAKDLDPAEDDKERRRRRRPPSRSL